MGRPRTEQGNVMSDSKTSTTSAPRRRFPLTLAALAGSAIAIPLYMVVATMTADEPAAAEVEVASADASAPTPAREADDRTVVAEKSAPSTAAPEIPSWTGTVSTKDAPADVGDMAKLDMAEEAPAAEPEPTAAIDDAMPAGDPASPPPAAPMRKSKSGGKGSAAADGRFAGEGGGFGADKALEIGGGPGGGGDGLRGRGETEREEARDADEDESGFDEQMRAGQLTAGIIDDVTSRQSLDELRAKLRYDNDIAQAIPDHGAAAPLPANVVTPDVVEIGLVIDTTGSMGDELEYLKTELRSIAHAIDTEYPGVQQRFALVAYKDHGDEYVVRDHGFEPIDAFLGHLGSEHASGGGDTPEAMDQALESASQLQWSQGASKLVFMVADAPPHTQDYQRYVKATASLANAEVSVYPVASSGIDTQCEYLMRWAARTTGGQYLFLTDHSGIGNAHAAPNVDSYELKSLRSHMLDVIRAELGTPGQGRAQAVAAAGEPQCAHGQCQAPWYERHSTFLWILGGMFMLGFAADMTRAWVSLRRHWQ